MFDNPKKELERLEQQLLAASKRAPKNQEFDDLEDEPVDEFEEDELFDDELDAILNGADSGHFDNRHAAQEFTRRSAGFDADLEEDDELERERYVPAPRKKSNAGMVFVAVLELALAIGLILWWAQHLGWLK